MKTRLIRQQGAVLIFTLVMLTLLTLAAVNMISQNKQELKMATNSRQQVRELATVEQLVARAEKAIDDDPVHTTCDPTTIGVTTAGSVSCSSSVVWSTTSPVTKAVKCSPKTNGTQWVQAPLFAGSRPTGLPDEAVITAVHCLNNNIEYLCSAAPSKTYISGTALSSITKYCYLTSNPSAESSPPPACPSSGLPLTTTSICYKTLSGATPYSCGTEIYTIRVTSTNTTTGAKRAVESRYAVPCDNIP